MSRDFSDPREHSPEFAGAFINRSLLYVRLRKHFEVLRLEDVQAAETLAPLLAELHAFTTRPHHFLGL